MKRLWYKFIFWMRKLRGNCTMCNKKKENHTNCIHCNFNRNICHHCGKHWSFGISRERTLKVLGQ
jgi:hypothetical protein